MSKHTEQSEGEVTPATRRVRLSEQGNSGGEHEPGTNTGETPRRVVECWTAQLMR
jgi:hypothetical protein